MSSGAELAEKEERSSSNTETTVPPPQSATTANKDELFNDFYKDLKKIESADSILTNKQQIERLLKPGSSYGNLNPFNVLNVDPETPLSVIKQTFRRLSILVHPDRNIDDQERSTKAFEAVNKAWKTLENEEGYKACQNVVEEAKDKVFEMMEKKRKDARKRGESTKIAEDDSETYKRALHVQTCTLFADLERLRQRTETKNAHEKKRKIEEDELEELRTQYQEEFDKGFEETRESRSTSWQSWKKTSEKSKKSKAPKVKPEVNVKGSKISRLNDKRSF